MPTLDSQLRARLLTGLAQNNLLDTSLLDIIQSAPMPSLGPGPNCPEIVCWLTAPRHPTAVSLPAAFRAGLWLLAGDLDASHEISQSDHSPQGSFWHGIMHRREGDFSNAKYWLRRIGRHKVFDQLARTQYGDPYRFVDRCEQADDATSQSLMAMQWLEWQHLFLFCLENQVPSKC